MKKLTSLFLILTSLFIISCGNNDDVDCSTVDCIAPGIIFEFVDKDTNENLLENESIDIEDIQISVDNLPSPDVHFSSIGSQIYLFVDNWPAENNLATVSLDANVVMEISVDIEKVRSECCSSNKISKVLVTTGDYTEVEKNFFRIFID